MITIGYIHTDFKEKFGIPRQSNLVNDLKGQITFEKGYGQIEAFNGLEDFEYIWLLFGFNKSVKDKFCATVKPPRLGGNIKKGVFATRSPFRPNSIGLSSVKLDRIEYTKEKDVILHVSGVDILDNSPIYDIKPYLPYTDAHTNVRAGFTDSLVISPLDVSGLDLLNDIPIDKQQAIINAIKEDPRPGYQDDPSKVYKMAFDKWDIHFTIANQVATIIKVILL